MSSRSFDLTIVGGGIVGAMLAWLTWVRHPNWHTLWVDRSLFGHGASAYSAGLITPFGRTDSHRSLATRSSFLLKRLAEDIGPLPIRELVAWFVTETERQAEISNWFIGGPVPAATRSDLQPLHRLLPEFALPERDVILGQFQVQQGWPLELITRIVSLCRGSRRFSIWEGVELTEWRPFGNLIKLSFLIGDAVESQRLVVATGPWQVPKGHALPGQVRIKKVAAYHLELSPADSAPVILFGDHDAFLLPLPEQQRWLFSFPSPLWGVEPGSPELAIDAEDDKIAEAILGRYLPGAAVHRRGGRIFCDSYTDNRVPLVCPVGDRSNVIYAGACSGSGFRLAPGIAEQALDMLEDTHCLNDLEKKETT